MLCAHRMRTTEDAQLNPVAQCGIGQTQDSVGFLSSRLIRLSWGIGIQVSKSYAPKSVHNVGLVKIEICNAVPMGFQIAVGSRLSFSRGSAPHPPPGVYRVFQDSGFRED
jgi:hypothetical protein